MKKVTVAFASLALGLAFITGCTSTSEKDANPGELPWCDVCQKYSECADQCAAMTKNANPGVVESADAKGDCCDSGAKADCGTACPEGKAGKCPEGKASQCPEGKASQECPHANGG